MEKITLNFNKHTYIFDPKNVEIEVSFFGGRKFYVTKAQDNTKISLSLNTVLTGTLRVSSKYTPIELNEIISDFTKLREEGYQRKIFVKSCHLFTIIATALKHFFSKSEYLTLLNELKEALEKAEENVKNVVDHHKNDPTFHESKTPYYLAKHYEKEKNPELALFWYEKAVEKDIHEAKYPLGLFYERGNLVNKDCAKALSLYQSAAEEGKIPEAIFRMGIEYEKKMDYAKALTYFDQVKDQMGKEATAHIESILERFHKDERPEAKIELGTFYEKGLGVKQDIKKAFQLYQYAYTMGFASATEKISALSAYCEKNVENPSSQYILGILYKEGITVEKDTLKAFSWFQKAALKGCGESNLLVQSLLEDVSVLLDFAKKSSKEKAFELYQKAAKLGSAEANRWLSSYYKEEKNRPLEFHYCKEAALLGDLEAKELLEKDELWFQKTPRTGPPPTNNELKLYKTIDAPWCNNALAQILFDGIYHKQDLIGAFKLFFFAAAAGDLDAQNDYAFCCQFGLGTSKNLISSQTWYENAAKQGHKAAQDNLAIFKEKGLAQK